MCVWGKENQTCSQILRPSATRAWCKLANLVFPEDAAFGTGIVGLYVSLFGPLVLLNLCCCFCCCGGLQGVGHIQAMVLAPGPDNLNLPFVPGVPPAIASLSLAPMRQTRFPYPCSNILMPTSDSLELRGTNSEKQTLKTGTKNRQLRTSRENAKGRGKSRRE